VNAPRAPGVVVCGVDGSAEGFEAAGAADQLSARLGACLLLVHVVPSAGHLALADSVAADALERPERERRRAGGRILREASERHGLEARVQFRVVAGSTVDALARLAARENAELLIIGGRRRGRLHRAATGDTALGLIRAAPCPVMVVCGPWGLAPQPSCSSAEAF